jgi:hypothetical protein
MDYLVIPKTNSRADILKAFISTLKNYYVNSERYQKFAYLSGLILIIGGLIHTLPLALNGFQWSGSISFRKPIVFGLAFGLNAWSFAWIMSYLPKLRKTSWTILIVYLLASIVEFIPISIQAWRGLPFHFNTLDPLSAIFWAIMGNAIVGIIVAVIAMTRWALFWLKAPSNYRIAIIIGLSIVLIGQGLGGWIISNATAVGGGNPEAILIMEGEFEAASIYGEAGNMKLPHFLALHAIQFLSILALFSQYTNWSIRKKNKIILFAAIGYIGFMSLVLYQVYNGLALFDLNIYSGVFFVLTLTVIAIACLMTYKGVRNRTI